ncbi:helix-turn-helix domain-containing protein [Paenibacillus sp. P96]|uniref:Helix-turn-helix domain-containing protein n=1 Tax=Paenibacillus zeirhizosphaerae TaxID=2987519 RepID=A0ABT9FXN1_9BACL|nr:helix-turn-helix domain-containing protein [Paenibacillus sp. P96]MDP4099496.1 helix-turn-helix domain-containing protein [Paenibacillus sp. P96]
MKLSSYINKLKSGDEVKSAESIQQQLQQIMGVPIGKVSLTDNVDPTLSDLLEKGKSDSGLASKAFLYDKLVFFPYYNGPEDKVAFTVEEHQITPRERQLIEALLAGLQTGSVQTHESTMSEEERMSRFGRWLLQQSTDESELPPEALKLSEALVNRMVPLLLQGDGSHQAWDTSYSQMNKLLDTYLGGDVLLVPLEQKEWLILANENLVLGGEDERDKDLSEPIEEVLTAFALGLYELIASEWGGVFHVSVAKPLLPTKGLPGTLSLLRETLHLGKLFHVSEHIHLPWELRLERLLYSIPDEQRRGFIQQAGVGSGLFGDTETLSTLDTFFQLDCNVSETAKRLYIHRNTLIYRLDKIKQESGLDVRTFNDAVLVRLILLLYKVTKSK